MSWVIAQTFAEASCTGWLCVAADEPAGEVSVSADEPVVAASVFKVLVALAVESAFIDGRLDPTRSVHLTAEGRTPGPTGLSLFEDEATASTRDLVSAMLTISDNVATDALLDLVGIDTCNRLAVHLGVSDTVIVSNLSDMTASIARDAGFEDWNAMTAWQTADAPAVERADIEERIRASSALDPATATRTTARDMCTLLRLIWTDRGGPPVACRRVRNHMGHQLTRNRLAAGFPPPWQVAAKSGGLLGIVRNEVGVIERQQPAPNRFYAAVFTRAEATTTEARVNAAIGTTAAAAVRSLTR